MTDLPRPHGGTPSEDPHGPGWAQPVWPAGAHDGTSPASVRPGRSGGSRRLWLVVGLVCALVLVLAGAGGGYWLLRHRGSTPARVAAPSASVSVQSSPVRTVVVGIDLPMRGDYALTSQDTVNAIKLYLEQVDGRAGRYAVQVKLYDDSAAETGVWDEKVCAANARDHVANADEVAVLGPYNSGCTKIEIPVLNTDPAGPMLMVSHANSNPGLTKPWEPGEPDGYYPTGRRNYARVVAPDDDQGVAAAQLAAKDLGSRTCLVLSDATPYGAGVARAFAAEARRQGITVVGEQAWKSTGSNAGLFTAGKGADCVYLGGIFRNNGPQVIRDKVATLGDNNAVKLIGPDGFSGYPELDKLAQAAGMYVTYAGAPIGYFRAQGGRGAAFLDAYKARYGTDPRSSFAVYGAQAMQVIMAAIERSDGTRKGVRDAVFSSVGLTVGATKTFAGKDVAIDARSGDTSERDIAITRIQAGAETDVKEWSIP